jgi:hypothetical protein
MKRHFQIRLREGDIQLPTRFVTDPDQMRAMVGRFDVHAQSWRMGLMWWINSGIARTGPER